ncbi:MAG: hypothetical protein HN855_08020 [Anaerolineae bacterium]|mgnify:CR=1 FL=1|jgi:hypothetical protein|nr:hypothetical protein [Anaerolineae bacterium]MBT7325088.1 hypothetical protein [Anaerolineae bacterium]
MAKVIVYLRDYELSALNQLAAQEYRVPKAQAALIIRKELERLELIPVEELPPKSNTDEVPQHHD